MKKPRLKYFVNLEGTGTEYDEKFDAELATDKTFYTRADFVERYGPTVKMFGSIFPVELVRAEPIKKHSFVEIFVTILLVTSLLYFVPDPKVHFSVGRWTFAIFISWLAGFLMGRLKMYGQQADADYFNKS